MSREHPRGGQRFHGRAEIRSAPNEIHPAGQVRKRLGRWKSAPALGQTQQETCRSGALRQQAFQNRPEMRKARRNRRECNRVHAQQKNRKGHAAQTGIRRFGAERDAAPAPALSPR